MENPLRKNKTDNMVSFDLPKVTIGIPVYNGEKHLREAIKSVLCQTFTDFELIITDDGSTDGSIQVVKQLDDPRIRLLADGENKGLPYRLNQQIQMARGVYFVRMDADDLMFPDRVEKQVGFLDRHTDVELVGAKAIIINEKGQVLYQSIRGGQEPHSKKEVMNGNFFMHPTVAGKTEWFRSHPYDVTKRRSQDFFLWLNSVEDSKFALMDVPVLFYRVEKTGLLIRSRKDNQLMRQFYWQQFQEEPTWFLFKKWLMYIVRWPLFLVYYLFNGGEKVIRKRYMEISLKDRNYYEAIMQKMK